MRGTARPTSHAPSRRCPLVLEGWASSLPIPSLPSSTDDRTPTRISPYPRSFPGGGGCICTSFASPSLRFSLPTPRGASAGEGCICTGEGPVRVAHEGTCTVSSVRCAAASGLPTRRRRDGGRVRGRTSVDLERTRQEHERTCEGLGRRERRGGEIEGEGVDEVEHQDECREIDWLTDGCASSNLALDGTLLGRCRKNKRISKGKGRKGKKVYVTSDPTRKP